MPARSSTNGAAARSRSVPADDDSATAGRPAPATAATATATDARNEVSLRARVAAPPEERTLPSGDSLMTARLIVDRDAAALQRSSQRVDTLDCVAWKARVHRTMRSWQAGDEVEVSGAIRRRFFRGAAGPVSRVEVEIKEAKRITRAP
ncbi:MAG: single-stranded DNA-binding protein [Nocardioidaceae bacterium]|nr:single-stranded DNA-binding protein [Nocardioidaceae bacterium]